MDCPKSVGELETDTFQGIQFLRCGGCKGLWFDILVKEDLLAIKGSELIDIGSEVEAEIY